jgi:thioredoxin-like negative regulator of GroEL
LSILERNRKFRDDAGRTVMIRIFRLLPKGSELAGRYRRRMFNFMH